MARRSGEKLAARISYRLPIAGGLVLLAAGLALGATTNIGSGYPFTAFWLTLAGLGIGLALAPATDAVLGVLPPERAGAGAAITLTLRQTGGALGVAAVGSLLTGIYATQVDVSALPAPAADAARDSVAAALTAAATLPDPALATSATTAYLNGMNLVLGACAILVVVGAGLIAAVMPSRAASHQPSARAVQSRS